MRKATFRMQYFLVVRLKVAEVKLESWKFWRKLNLIYENFFKYMWQASKGAVTIFAVSFEVIEKGVRTFKTECLVDFNELYVPFSRSYFYYEKRNYSIYLQVVGKNLSHFVESYLNQQYIKVSYLKKTHIAHTCSLYDSLSTHSRIKIVITVVTLLRPSLSFFSFFWTRDT